MNVATDYARSEQLAIIDRLLQVVRPSFVIWRRLFSTAKMHAVQHEFIFLLSIVSLSWAL